MKTVRIIVDTVQGPRLTAQGGGWAIAAWAAGWIKSGRSNILLGPDLYRMDKILEKLLA